MSDSLSEETRKEMLTTRNHDRDVVGMTYLYPVISRRAGGVSIGINLNPNNACNWHCAYCQVPDLVRGSAPEIDLEKLKDELTTMLNDVVNGSFMQDRVTEDCRKLCDIAISGNGEPTSCKNFDTIVKLIIEVMQSFALNDEVKLRLITNGSYLHKPNVQTGLKLMGNNNGEVWVKVDSATEAGIKRINGVTATPELLFKQVKAVAELCPTWIQTCMFAWDGAEPSEEEMNAYLGFVKQLKADAVPVQGVLLYGLARESMQPEAAHLSALDEGWMKAMAVKIERAGLSVKLSL
ncbi:MAG TPA: radical SAM protein [Mariprofundaceae bacterium]|nr:radical SAM protein [Mariprofundaceae bacterium]